MLTAAHDQQKGAMTSPRHLQYTVLQRCVVVIAKLPVVSVSCSLYSIDWQRRPKCNSLRVSYTFITVYLLLVYSIWNTTINGKHRANRWNYLRTNTCRVEFLHWLTANNIIGKEKQSFRPLTEIWPVETYHFFPNFQWTLLPLYFSFNSGLHKYTVFALIESNELL